ncbi:extracellular solute-binding protein [Kaistia dalseonensis]|uniref:Multiple sugar transport system substrate-binding protein n=1 Tax=Kaistia dalseonensis TaxID=410840 RepID=A0ABU0HC03_9HYPH|nr:extracellular solute-binding protein [Kaistia dalseonensis]MCX5497200.1 extracellular solute-binding protein [Kaistia dalseonensis]MDQ0439831.1 multiple sugar transport system substrate-binding protein [Kaistia dalseonensis]
MIKTSAKRLGLAALASLALASTALAADKPYAGLTLNLASQNDQFAAVIAKLAPQFEEKTGATVKVDILDYGSLLTKTQADFVGHTKNYDLITMDIVWAGQYADNGYTVDLTDWIKRDAAELQLDDIYPATIKYIGQYNGKQVAFPFAGYAAVMAYRKDLLDAAGIKVPETAEDFVAAAIKLTDPSKKIYGFVANGQKGAAVAQDWLQYNAQLGGSILSADGKPTLNSDANVASLKVYKELFDKAAPPGAVDYDWGGREESFRQGLVAMMETWSVGAPGYYDPNMSKIVDSVAITYTPVGKGLPVKYGLGGWGMGINADIDDKQKEASWAFIKWLTSPEVQKEFNMEGAGSYIRKSTLADPDLNKKYPFLPVIAKSFENADGDYRPRIPQYPEMQDLLGTAVNAVLVGGTDPKAALDEAQEKAAQLF